MNFKALASTALVASLSFSPVSPFVTPARADGKDVVAGLIIGGIIGSAIASENGKKKKSTSKSKGKSKSKSTKSAAPAMDPAVKAANIEVQQALNHFGWAVGTADGALGPKSKAAVKEYQGFMGFPVSGELTPYERTVLVTAFHRAEAGGTAISEIVSSSVYGLRGVLIAQNDEMAGSGDQMAAATITPDSAAPKPGDVAAAAAAAIPVLLPKTPVAESPTVTAPASPIIASPAPAPAPEPAPEPTVVVAVEPEPAPVVEPVVEPIPVAEPDTSGPGLPTFLDANGGKGPLAQHCAAIALKTATNGGYVTEASMTDATFALAEQFCLTRAAAIQTGKDLTANVSGFTPAQISEQCGALAPALAEHVAALSLKPQAEVLAGVERFVLTSGMSPAQLSGTAKVCLGVGYGEDRMDVAVGSALLLTALGEKGYAELLGHHLSQGFGATPRADLAEGWYEVAVEAMGQGGTVFATDFAGRDGLILRAAYTLTGKAADLEPVVQEAALPSFVVTPAPEATLPVAPVADTVSDTASDTAARVEGPGADAIRMGAEVAKMAATAPLMLLIAN